MLKQEERIDYQEPSTSKQEESVQEQIYLISSNEISDSDESGGSSSSSSSFEISTRPKLPMKQKTRIKLQALAEACNRTGVSDRGASFIPSSVLDVGSIQKKDFNSVIDRNKIWRARKSSF